MNQNLFTNHLGYCLSYNMNQSLEAYSKERDQYNSLIEVLTEDRIRLKFDNEELIKKNSKLILKYEGAKDEIILQKKKNQKIEQENKKLIQEIQEKDLVIMKARQLLNDASLSMNTIPKRNNSASESVKPANKIRRRPIVTVNPNGFTQSFYK